MRIPQAEPAFFGGRKKEEGRKGKERKRVRFGKFRTQEGVGRGFEAGERRNPFGKDGDGDSDKNGGGEKNQGRG